VATDDIPDNRKMALQTAKDLIVELAQAGIGGISFSAGEPFLYLNDMTELVQLCSQIGIYTRIVTNSFWAKTSESADSIVTGLKENGLCQVRLSYSRWHQKHINRNNVLNAARSCQKIGLNYFISFVTDFSQEDESHEQFLRDHGLTFFPEPVIYAGRAGDFKRRHIQTDYQANCCIMNPYLSPDRDMFACCDAGSHFTKTNFFYLGSLNDNTIEQMFVKSETNRLYNLIRTMGLTPIASFAGMTSRDIISYGKCDLCRILFNCPESLTRLWTNLPHMEAWCR